MRKKQSEELSLLDYRAPKLEDVSDRLPEPKSLPSSPPEVVRAKEEPLIKEIEQQNPLYALAEVINNEEVNESYEITNEDQKDIVEILEDWNSEIYFFGTEEQEEYTSPQNDGKILESVLCEQLLLGSYIRDYRLMDFHDQTRVNTIFHDGAHRGIHTCFVSLEGKKDLEGLITELASKKALNISGGVEYLGLLVESAEDYSSPEHVEAYVKVLETVAQIREKEDARTV